MAGPSVDNIIRRLGLTPHPEGGHFRETWRDVPANGGRGSGEVSRWHKVDAAEIWHFYAGDPLELRIAQRGSDPVATHLLGRDIENGERPQIILPKDAWQSARIATPKIGWVLVGCTVSPAFDFAGFELARDGWEP